MRNGTVLKVGSIVLLSLLLIVLGAQIWSFVSETRNAQGDFNSLKSKLDQAKEDQSKSTADLNYYLNPENLKKELKGRFNYKEPGEKMIIVVGGAAASSTPSSTDTSKK